MIYNHMFIFQVRDKDDLVSFVSGIIENRERDIIILHLKKDCFSTISEMEFENIKGILRDPHVLSVLLIDCEISMRLYEKMHVFDLCCVSEDGALRYDPDNRTALRLLRLLSAPKYFVSKEARIMEYEELISHGFINVLLRKDSFYEDLESQILSLTYERTKEQLRGIKDCMNAYKDCCLLGERPLTDLETRYFCKLALLKTEVDKK